MSENPVFAQIKQEVDDNDVVLFMKGTPMFPQCGFSAAVVQALSVTMDYIEKSKLIFLSHGFVIAHQGFSVALDNRDRRLQLMGSVGNELLPHVL